MAMLALFAFATACTSAAPDSGGDTAAPADTADTADTDWTEETAITSDDGHFYVMYSPDVDPIPYNETFSMYWMVHDGADHSHMLGDTTLTLDVTMPEHGHGMNTEPQITQDAAGGFQVDGMLFHMRGWWALAATITEGDVVDHATFYIDCCEG